MIPTLNAALNVDSLNAQHAKLDALHPDDLNCLDDLIIDALHPTDALHSLDYLLPLDGLYP